MGLYPQKIQRLALKPSYSGVIDGESARGKDASFICGSFARFSIVIDAGAKTVSQAAFQTNGCGYMAAAADVLCDLVTGTHLGELHGLDEEELKRLIVDVIGASPAGRTHCVDTCISALRAAFADYRVKQINEFSGETALICTCFGVAEETIMEHIEAGEALTIDDIGRVCNAGRGCGSCRMLIQEMLDIDEREGLG